MRKESGGTDKERREKKKDMRRDGARERKGGYQQKARVDRH